MTERYVIIGASAAGSSAAETLRRHAPKAQITVVSDEKITYSKPLLSYYLAGHLGEEQLFLRAPDFYERYGIQRFTRGRWACARRRIRSSSRMGRSSNTISSYSRPGPRPASPRSKRFGAMGSSGCANSRMLKGS
jgi:hypothetical protein